MSEFSLEPLFRSAVRSIHTHPIVAFSDFSTGVNPPNAHVWLKNGFDGPDGKKQTSGDVFAVSGWLLNCIHLKSGRTFKQMLKEADAKRLAERRVQRAKEWIQTP